MFEDQFAAWKYGPVMVVVRDRFRANDLHTLPTEEELQPYQEVMDYVFKNYATHSSWTLSLLTHGESCWQKARQGLDEEAHCDELIKTEDIAMDAERMKMRRFYFDVIVPELEKMRQSHGENN